MNQDKQAINDVAVQTVILFSSIRRRSTPHSLVLLFLLGVVGWSIGTAPIAEGQLVILEPRSLAKLFHGGKVEGSTAAFGTPYYGKRIAGNLLFFDKTGCDEDDYYFDVSSDSGDNNIVLADNPQQRRTRRILQSSDADPNPNIPFHPTSSSSSEGLRTVVMVRRGDCHFVTKVLVAEKKGATAVVIVDSKGSMTEAKHVKKTIMADDGWGDGVVIPSLLIGEKDGILLIDELVKGHQVIVELAWDVPKASPVQIDQWISPAFVDTTAYLKEFAPYALTMKHKIDFRVHYVVITLPGDFKSMCTDKSGRFCGWDPDKGGETTGKDIMEETVRQLCIWEVTQKLDEKDPESGFYSEPWWKYVQALPDRCPHKGDFKHDEELAKKLDMSPEEFKDAHTLGEKCSNQLLVEFGVNVVNVNKCYKHNFEALLTRELLNKAWSSTAIIINNWRYSGPLDAEQVARTVCTGYTEQPEECKKLFHPSRMELIREGLLVEKLKGFETWKVILISIFASLIGIVFAVVLYWYCIHQRIRSSLRYSIMDEMKRNTVNPAAGSTSAYSSSAAVPPASSPYLVSAHLPFHESPTSSSSADPLPATKKMGDPDDVRTGLPLGRPFVFDQDN